MSGEEWNAVREQVEVIATEVVDWERTTDVIYSLRRRQVLSEADMDHLMVRGGKGEERGGKGREEVENYE